MKSIYLKLMAVPLLLVSTSQAMAAEDATVVSLMADMLDTLNAIKSNNAAIAAVIVSLILLFAGIYWLKRGVNSK